ncbi:MAG: GNAT family N-acetyltransferase, partial [Candidatus Aenigmatarchaeota archaeon]
MDEELKIEEVKRSDRKEVESLSEGIWDGWDYIPEVFDEWIEDGGFLCGKKNGNMITLGKHTRQSEDVLWLEGLRVHPEYQEQGYGRKMIEGQLYHIKENLDYEVLRFLTTGDKSPVRKVAEELGFKVKKEYPYLRLDEEYLEKIEAPSTEEVGRVGREKDPEEVYDLILSSPEIEEYEKLYIEGWTAYEINPDLIRERVGRGNCFSIRENGDLKAVMFTHIRDIYERMSVSFISGSKEEIEELLKFGIKKTMESGLKAFTIKT